VVHPSSGVPSSCSYSKAIASVLVLVWIAVLNLLTTAIRDTFTLFVVVFDDD
jgi:hypothetical protein